MQFGITDILTLVGALGLFLYGMKVMSDSLMDVAGDRLRNILATMTSNRVFGVLTGFIITAIIQSSSATTLMVVSFVNASLLTLAESVSVIMGANIGTTVTAWLITILGFKVSMSALALPLVGIGFFLTFSKRVKVRTWGTFIVGFAVLFIGLQFLKDSMPDIKQHPEVLAWLEAYTDMGLLSVLLFLFIGTVLTVVVQSSSATMALTLVMCYEGWIPFDMAAAMVLGENVGTTITANLAAIVANYNAKRTARAHFIFNSVGVVWMIILFIPYLAVVEWFVTRNGSASPFTTPEAVPVALSVFHTSFNIINSFVLIWFVPLIVKAVERMVPIEEEQQVALDEPKFLSDAALAYPQTAIRALLDETKRLLEGPAFKIVSHSLNLPRTDIRSGEKPKNILKDAKDIIEINVDEEYYSKVKSIYGRIFEFSTRTLSLFSLGPVQADMVTRIRMANRYIVEAIKDAGQLQGNIDKYLLSDNAHMKKEYDALRKKMIRVLQEVHWLANAEEPETHLEAVERLRRKAKKNDAMVDGTLDRLIREGKITSTMAASLANDSNYVADISNHLLAAAELLYVQSDTILAEFPAEAQDAA